MPRNNRATLMASAAATAAPVIEYEDLTPHIDEANRPAGGIDTGWPDPADEPTDIRVSARPAAPRRPPPWLDDNDRVLTVDETAALLGVSTFTLLRMRQRPDADGLLFVQLSPKRIGYRLGDIRSYLRARRVGSLTEAA